jgi:hypothetical protein
MSKELESFKQATSISLQASTSDVEADYQLARDNIKTVLGDAREAIDEMLQVAKTSQNPRAYEVLANLLKTTADINNQLLHVSKQYNDISGINNSGDTNINAENVIYMTTADLQKAINGKNKDDKPKVIDNE